jgi:hypothetical protein
MACPEAGKDNQQHIIDNTVAQTANPALGADHVTSDTCILGDTDNRRRCQHLHELIQHTGLCPPAQVTLVMLSTVPILDEDNALTAAFYVDL